MMTPISRRLVHGLSAAWVTLALLSGCSLLDKSDGKDSDMSSILEAPEPPELIREAVAPRGLDPIRVTGVGLVNSLPGTGGPTDPSGYRDKLIEEMRRNDVKDPNAILELDDNSLVTVTAVVPPAAKRGDRVDLMLSAPATSNTSDLHGGWLLDTRMRMQQIIKGRLRSGELMAVGMGGLLTRGDVEGETERSNQTQAYVLGGAVVQKTRDLGLVIRPEFKHVEISKKISSAINRRFFFFDGTTRRGVSNPVEDDFIELELHPRYEDSLGRYIAVINATMVDRNQSSRQDRLMALAEQLTDVATASDAALQLEALGESAIPTLLTAIRSQDAELRFYAAEALAYLDRDEAIPVLVDSIKRDAAFRHASLLALRRMDDPRASDAIASLFDEPSIETRYGAFDTLQARADGAAWYSSDRVTEQMSVYEVASTAPAAIAVSTRRRAEIVLFGTGTPLKVDTAILGPAGLVIRSAPTDPSKLRISRFQAGEQDRRTVAPATVVGLIQGIADIGGDYADVVATLRRAKAKGFLKDQLAIDPLPKALRTYYRDGVSSES
ncbi:MAG: flagellar basal body P-ring protein FlgI [Planctomycetota bacterium]